MKKLSQKIFEIYVYIVLLWVIFALGLDIYVILNKGLK